jgi:hypothetical protein
VSEPLPVPIDAPDGQSYVVRAYRTGTMSRFPSADTTPAPGGVLLWPLVLLGGLVHMAVFRRRWTVAVTRWHNMPAWRYRERVESKATAVARADALQNAIRSGEWVPGKAPPQPG